MRYVLRYLAPYKRRMALGLTVKISATTVELFIPYILSHILKVVVLGESVLNILLWGGIMLLCAALACAGNITANRMAARVSANFSREMRMALFEKTLSLSASEIDRFTVPSLESRITTDTYNVHNFVSMMQRMGVRAPILLIGGVTVTLVMDARLALVMIALLPFIFVTVFFISKKGIPLYRKVQRSVDGMVRVVREDCTGIRVIKALSKGDYENRRYDKENARLSHDERRAGVIMGSVNPIMTMLMNIGIIGVVALSAFMVDADKSSPETVVAFMQYFTLISMAMMSVSRIFVMYTKCAASARRIEQVMVSESSIRVIPEGKEKPEAEGYITFKEVGFSYIGRGKHLSDISFSLKRGEHLGIIGATGSGKSTLIKLLMRFYDADSGEIFIDGRDIRSYTHGELTSLFGAAMQSDFLYNDTIMENIKFARDISDAAAIRAAKIAQADDFISSFADGYNYMLTQKGTNVSGGQKQRILIARAIAADPDILILDDSSSALDYKTDASLRSALAAELSGTTVITVAQRVSSVKDCDLIILIDDGKISAMGTHAELLLRSPEYKEIADSQMGGAFVE
ncbi:MAG: ABC transporter ATP-binding protein [Clostridia bacterium]|nr:ABC transporter ATP-binding protein [Clostridia bacterium]